MLDRPNASEVRERRKHDENAITRPQKFRMAHDNMYHFFRLADSIFREHALLTNADGAIPQIQYNMKRMIALVAIVYGCISEGSLWLPIMDFLLENLARRVVGHTDVNFEMVSSKALSILLTVSLY